MTATHKSTKAGKAEVAETFLPLYKKNVERVAELQKKALEVAADQTAEVMNAWKKVFDTVPNTPGLFMFDLFGQTFDRFVETEKGMINLAMEQSEALFSIARDRGMSAENIVDSATTVFQQTVDHSVALHKKTLDHFAEQQKKAYESAKKQFQFMTPGAEAFENGIDALIETQKVILDIASKPMKHAAAA
jgi:hypothetical protein